ncbi:MAG: permease [Planctomycetaceae bacterium]|nr:permease [Planctomycetaceae bacterium]
MIELLQTIWSIWLQLAPWLLLGAVIAGILHVVLPTGWLHRQLSGRAGVLKAVLFGVPLPLCSCGVIPVGLGLKKSGAGNGATVGFLISTPQTGVDSILVSASFLGWPFAVLKVVVALITGIVGGLLTDFVVPPADVSMQVPVESAIRPRKLQAFRDHTLMLIQSVWGWLVTGVIVSAVITVMAPQEFVSNLPGTSGIPALLVTLLISLPLYVCATASVPIAAALVASGLPPGAALVFLMAGPATNVATLGAVYRTLGLKSLVVYLVTIVAGSLIAGIGFNSVLAGTVSRHLHEHSGGPLAVFSGVLLAGLIAWFATQDLQRWWHKRRSAKIGDGSQMTVVKVAGMTCNGCAGRLERVLKATDGVRQASVSFADGEARVEGTASADRIRRTVENAGFQPGPVVNTTDSCCESHGALQR